MKATLRIPTKESYAYIEVECEGDEREIINQYQKFRLAVQGGFGLPDKEWNMALDRYRQGKGMDVEKHEGMDERQQWMVHELDKSDARLKNKTK